MTGTEGEKKPARVVVADDQTVIREGIVMLLGLLPGIEVIGAAGSVVQVLVRFSDQR